MTHWNANNYSKQMAKDIKKIRATQRIQEGLLNGSIPATPIEENHMLRRMSKPTVFSLARLPVSEEQDPRSLLSSPDRNRRRSSLTSSNNVETFLVPSSPPPSTDTLLSLPHQRHPLRSEQDYSLVDIHRIQAENNLLLSQINNAPVEYSKPVTYETE